MLSRVPVVSFELVLPSEDYGTPTHTVFIILILRGGEVRN